jgi:succinate-acetate transporter protein
MPTAQQDTEITLSTGRMLVIFFTFVMVCAFFFAIGFLLGRKTTIARAGGLLGVSAGAP